MQATNCMWCGRLLATSGPQPQYSQSPQPVYPQPAYPQMPMSPPPPVPQARKRNTGCIIAGVLVGGVVLCFISLYVIYLVFGRNASVIATTPPDYVKEVVAYAEGDRAFVIYFILADKDGQMTTSDGKATLSITDETNTLYTKTVTVHRTDFQLTTRGQGAFKNDAILYTFGRITYDLFDREPDALTGEVSVTFAPSSGSKMSGKTSVFFDK